MCCSGRLARIPCVFGDEKATPTATLVKNVFPRFYVITVAVLAVLVGVFRIQAFTFAAPFFVVWLSAMHKSPIGSKIVKPSPGTIRTLDAEVQQVAHFSVVLSSSTSILSGRIATGSAPITFRKRRVKTVAQRTSPTI